jgi:hypothetical protein
VESIGRLLQTAEQIYWTIGIFIVLGGFVIFVFEMLKLGLAKMRTPKRREPDWIMGVVVDEEPPTATSTLEEPPLKVLPAARPALPPAPDDPR